jgi:hypothetical protein
MESSLAVSILGKGYFKCFLMIICIGVCFGGNGEGDVLLAAGCEFENRHNLACAQFSTRLPMLAPCNFCHIKA